ncbi:hypothetical protein [Hymenobacter defluvii]|uniref:Uncharacterized protein n=1 Tax=Hymenobacter defluvii TaxID=2054411 RepID=A0ABS3TI52_9BACT|nr:hypothetical protein [Hymenobacter defluvii]MBO3273347.1 hypothetical protein [Hymenobacter defluvii]
MYTTELPADSLSWAARNRFVHPNIRVVAGKHYQLRVSSQTSTGCYGLAYAAGQNAGFGETQITAGSEKAKAPEEKQTLKFQLFMQAKK